MDAIDRIYGSLRRRDTDLPFGLTLVTGPASEPVALSDVKSRLQITVPDMDADLTALITEARVMCEAVTNRAFLPQTWLLTLDRWPHSRVIPIPRPPLVSVDWVKYYDTTGTQQMLNTSNYYVATGSEPGRVVRNIGYPWPITSYGRPESVSIQFQAGWANAGAVPAAARAAMMLIVADRYDNPGNANGVDIPPAARRLLDTIDPGEVW